MTVCSTDSPSTQPQTEECQQDSPVELKSVEPTDIKQRNDAILDSLDSQDSHCGTVTCDPELNVCTGSPELNCESQISCNQGPVTRSMTANIETSTSDINDDNNSDSNPDKSEDKPEPKPFSWDWVPPPDYCWSCFANTCLISKQNDYKAHNNVRKLNQ